MSSTLQTSRNQTEQRALQLLGSGLGPSVVATAIGISESRISQLMSMPDFAAEVSTLRFNNLQKHNEMDDKYDEMEKKLAESLKEQLPMMMRPMEILRALSTINGMKRRGQSAPDQIVHQNTVVNLLMPQVVVQKFTTNVNNQVIHAGDQTLETIQGSVLLNAAKAKLNGLHNEIPTYTSVTEVGSPRDESSGPAQISDGREK